MTERSNLCWSHQSNWWLPFGGVIAAKLEAIPPEAKRLSVLQVEHVSLRGHADFLNARGPRLRYIPLILITSGDTGEFAERQEEELDFMLSYALGTLVAAQAQSDDPGLMNVDVRRR